MGVLKGNSLKGSGLKGEIEIPSDKSISHRSLILGALVKNKIKISNLLKSADCLATLDILKKLGASVEFLNEKDLILNSKNMFKVPSKTLPPLDCKNSGTTMRLMAGVLAGAKISSAGLISGAGQDLNATLIGDESLSKRPMKRIIEPLTLMGADIKSNDFKPPLKIRGQNLKAINYHTPIASAQVKSCILLAGLSAEGTTIVTEDNLSRNHTEIMLKYLDADIEVGKTAEGAFFAEIQKSNLEAKDITICGDISSAAFLMVAAAIIENSDILIKNVGLNPTRTGILKVFKEAKIDFEILNEREISNEKVGDIRVKYTKDIKPFKIEGDIIPELIDEIPILALLATQADGETIIKDAQDLRNKESDRIKEIARGLKLLGADIEEKPDGFIINGKTKLDGGIKLNSNLDHRLAMTYHIASLISENPVEISGVDCIDTSFPEFFSLLSKLGY